MKKNSFIHLSVALILGIVFSGQAQSASLMNRKGSLNKGSASQFQHINLKPTILGFGVNSCVQMGSQITVLGAHFGAQKLLTLTIGSSVKTLKTVAWTDTRIDAYLPSKGLKRNTHYPLEIRDTKTKKKLSLSNKSILICSKNKAISSFDKPLAGSFSNKIATPPSPTVSSHPDDVIPVEVIEETIEEAQEVIEESISSPEKNNAFLPGKLGSLIGRQLPSLPPKLARANNTETPDNEIAEPNELMVVSQTMNEAQQLDQQLLTYAIRPKKRKLLKNLGLVMTTYRVPAGVDIQHTAASIREAFPSMVADVNHRFTLQGNKRSTRVAKQLVKWKKEYEKCGVNLRVGLLDTGINKEHPALKTQKITSHSVLSRGITKAKTAHGTAIASLLIGQQNSAQFSGLIPDAHLFAATVFRQKTKRHIDTTAEWIVSGIDWLLSQKVTVINMSIGGPRNLLVEIALKTTLKSGVVVVAAAGNGGLKATPVYPAAQQGVIAVTAVDSDLTLYKKANIGNYIDFAAPGVDLWAGNEKGAGKFVSGTSFAVPYVVAALATLTNNNSPKEAYLSLKKTAQDLGGKGKDKHYGWGLIQVTKACLK